MQPWKISTGLTAALAGSAVFLAGPRLQYLAPFWSVILADHGVSDCRYTWHWGSQPLLALDLRASLAAAGLADLGRRVDLVERSVRRGEGDPELAEALKRDAEGDWE